MSLDCPFLVAPRFSLTFICLSSSCFLCAEGCQCLWIVHSCFPLGFLSRLFVCLRPVSCVPMVANVSGLFILDCFLGFLYRLFVRLRPVSCVPRVANVSGLSIVGCSSVFSNVYLFVVVLCLVCRGLPMSLDCSFLFSPRFSLTFICLSSSCVMCAEGCQCLWIVHS
jgi:hypothetical protein